VQDNATAFKEVEEKFIKRYIKGTPEIYRRIHGS
jgi:hypothetical protein